MLRSCFAILFVLCSLSAGAQLVYSPAYRKQLNEHYTAGLFSSDDAYMIVPDDDRSSSAYFNVLQYLQGRVPGLYIHNIYGYGSTAHVFYRGGRPAFFVDEMRVDQCAINSISLYDVALIKVFRSPFMGAIGGAPNGAIAVYTKRGDEE